MSLKESCSKCGKEDYIFDTKNKLCWSCREDARIKELQKEVVEKGRMDCEDYIICPYCGHDYGTDEMYDSTDVNCYGCNKEFHVEVNHSIDYSTSKIEGEGEGKP